MNDLGTKWLKKDFEKSISISLRELGMTNARFKVHIEPNTQGMIDYNIKGKRILAKENGFDNVYFEVALNSSDSFRPLHKTASGGEISRIMLAIKVALSNNDRFVLNTGIGSKRAKPN